MGSYHAFFAGKLGRMKLAITGKGGVGKTTTAVFLAKYLAGKGDPVVLIDADPDANTAGTLGLPEERHPEPISELDDLIAERTGADRTGGAFFSLNPRVDDVPERYAVGVDGVKLLRMGRLARGGSGCFCPENAFLKNLLAHLLFGDDSTVILDMEAGLEHLGRATAQGVDIMIAVVEPSRPSIETAFAIRRYAADIGLTRIGVVINRCRSQQQQQTVAEALGDLPVFGSFPYDDAVARASLAGACPYIGSEDQERRVEHVLTAIAEYMQRRETPAESLQ